MRYNLPMPTLRRSPPPNHAARWADTTLTMTAPPEDVLAAYGNPDADGFILLVAEDGAGIKLQNVYGDRWKVGWSDAHKKPGSGRRLAGRVLGEWVSG